MRYSDVSLCFEFAFEGEFLKDGHILGLWGIRSGNVEDLGEGGGTGEAKSKTRTGIDKLDILGKLPNAEGMLKLCICGG